MMFPEQYEDLKQLIKNNGVCRPDPERCTMCALRVPFKRGHSSCGIPSAKLATEAFAIIKQKAIEKLLEHGYTEEVIEILL